LRDPRGSLAGSVRRRHGKQANQDRPSTPDRRFVIVLSSTIITEFGPAAVVHSDLLNQTRLIDIPLVLLFPGVLLHQIPSPEANCSPASLWKVWQPCCLESFLCAGSSLRNLPAALGWTPSTVIAGSKFLTNIRAERAKDTGSGGVPLMPLLFAPKLDDP